MTHKAKNEPSDPTQRNKRARKRSRIVARIAFAAALFAASLANAQSINESVTIEDLGFTRRLVSAARPAGLGGAYTSIGDDTHSLIYNPAGLAGVRRIELGIGFQHSQTNLKNRFFGTPNEVEVSTTDLDYISGAYPVPTYRGSLVIAGGVYRVHTSDIDILNRGVNLSTLTMDDYRLQQNGSVYSYNAGLGFDLSPSVSVGVNLFVLDGTITALTQFSYALISPLQQNDFESESLIDDAKVDLDGYGAILGFQYHAHQVIHFGLSVATPTAINISGTASQENVLYFYQAADSFYQDNFAIDVDYRLPFRVDAGLSVTPWSFFLLSADVGYVDWTQAQVNGIRLKDENLVPVFRKVEDLDDLHFRCGLEMTMPIIPVRLRGGYARTPYALRALQPDRIDAESRVQPAIITAERETYSVGVGILAGKVLTIDAAYELTTGERVIPTLQDNREMQRFLLSTSYRF